MPEGKDPAIKLFGTKIPLPEGEMLAGEGYDGDLAPAIKLPLEGKKDSLEEKSTRALKPAEEQRHEHDQKEGNSSGEQKALKKPDKILPCPRCESMDTKFCYYNNYNVNQPRHFCKNCQRYWTAGGTMRNVPVGAGRRKNKHAVSNYRHSILTPDPLTSAQIDCSDVTTSISKKSSKGAGSTTLLKFGPDAPLCESIASILNLGEQKLSSELGTEAREEPSCSSKLEENGQYWPNCPYPWNPGCILGHENGFLRAPVITVPMFCAPALPFPFPIASTSFFGWNGWPWNLPWTGYINGVSSSSSSTSTGKGSGNSSPTLGKHSRETEKSLWVPKTLRIDDPDEAAKSSIFATLGIKPDECGRFRAFRRNSDGRKDVSDSVKLLQSNPAALSRSHSFQEAT